MKRALILVLALAAASCKPPEQPRTGAAHLRKPVVTVETVVSREIEYVVEAVGSVEAAEEISIPARVSGVLDAVHFKEGDTVEPSTLLAEIAVERYRLAEERAKADHDHARAQTTLAETVFKNRLTLYDEGKKQKKEWVTEEQMATWRADVDKAKADLERARVDLELARKSHRDARVQSPLAGIINRKQVSRGEYVKPETVVATILNVGTLHVRFTAPELEASRLRAGQEILFTVRSDPGKTFRARLFHVSQKADPATRAVQCAAEVVETHGSFRAGLFVSIRIITGKQAALLVPERAVLPTERGFLLVVTDGRKASRRPVELGMRVGQRVEVTQGLAAGEKIVVDGAGAASLRDGIEIEVATEAAK